MSERGEDSGFVNRKIDQNTYADSNAATSKSLWQKIASRGTIGNASSEKINKAKWGWQDKRAPIELTDATKSKTLERLKKLIRRFLK